MKVPHQRQYHTITKCAWGGQGVPGPTTPSLPLTLIEVQGAHGIAHNRGELIQVRGTLQQFLHQPCIQAGAADHPLPQDNLLKLRLEALIHCLLRDDYRARLQT